MFRWLETPEQTAERKARDAEVQEIGHAPDRLRAEAEHRRSTGWRFWNWS